MFGLSQQDAPFRAVSEALLAEVERALAQAEQAAANELRAQGETPAGAELPSWDAPFAQVVGRLAQMETCLGAVREEAKRMDELLRREEEMLAAWVGEARRTGDTLAGWAGDTV